MCIEANKPVHLMVGYTGWGAGYRGGLGCPLEPCHPKYVDEVAAMFPELNIIAARPAWPWQTEMIAILMHKANIIGYDLHGWSPKYFAPDLKWEISHRLQDRVIFGADYPMFSYERLYRDWEAEGYSKEILDKVAQSNLPTKTILKELGISRSTYYSWLKRYEEHGDEGLLDSRSLPKAQEREVGAAPPAEESERRPDEDAGNEVTLQSLHGVPFNWRRPWRPTFRQACCPP